MVTEQNDKNNPTNHLQQSNNGGAIRIRTSAPPSRPERNYNGRLELNLSPTRSFSGSSTGSSETPTAAGTHSGGGAWRRIRQRTHTGEPYAATTRQQRVRVRKSETIPPPYEWATDRRATLRSLNELLSREIRSVKGEVQCKRCEEQYEMEFDLQQKFNEVGRFLSANRAEFHERAPDVWMNPVLPTCRHCMQENSAKPVIPKSKKAINWLFLLLGQMVGCCTLDQLRYFCKHTQNHRTGAKDRVLYLTYLTLCRQLDPTGPFHR